MYRQLLIIAAKAVWCHCFAAYEQFEGFDPTLAPSSQSPTDPTSTAHATAPHTTPPARTWMGKDSEELHRSSTLAYNMSKSQKFLCPEEEQPMNLGPYEVPTRRDLALLARKTLERMFGSYHQKALFLLDDIKKATRATVDVEKSCATNKPLYRQCVMRVSTRCEAITKGLAISLERQRHHVTELSQSSVCNMSAMKQDPVTLVKILAVEEASLEFALPAFLRLLSACSNYCISSYKQALKPLHNMSDTDLVIKHCLTKNNYEQLRVF